MSVSPARLIPLHVCGGAENMAADQALMESVDVSAKPVLRFYAWREATLSLGYFQQASDRGTHRESQMIDCVRRATGGGAIVHDCELTYSLVVPVDPGSAGPRTELYRTTHQSLIAALLEHGVRAAPFRKLASENPPSVADPFLCFQRRTAEDLIVSGYKVVGSAQRKSRASVLQHGSVLIRASQWAPQLPGIEDLTSQRIALESLAASFAAQLGVALSFSWETGDFTESERSRAETLTRDRYASERWLGRR